MNLEIIGKSSVYVINTMQDLDKIIRKRTPFTKIVRDSGPQFFRMH